MSIPGTNVEDDAPPVNEGTPGEAQPVEHEDEDAPIIETVTNAAGDKLVPLATLIAERKAADARGERRAAAKLQAEIARIQQEVEQIRPYADAIRANPGLVDQINRGTRESKPTTPQPEDDGEAQEWAQENGLITATGELDVARARRQLTLLDKRAEQKAAQMVGPIRQNAASQQAYANVAQAKTVTLKDGTLFATAESLEHAGRLLPPELLADKNVAALLPIIGAGLDRLFGRTPSVTAPPEEVYGEPAISEPIGRRGTQISTEVRRLLDQTGVSEKDYAAVSKAYQPGKHLALE